jgi:hypothetical protein
MAGASKLPRMSNPAIAQHRLHTKREMRTGLTGNPKGIRNTYSEGTASYLRRSGISFFTGCCPSFF